MFELAINILNSGELAGATFSPDGRTLFFNMLGSGSGSVRPYTGVEGMTFALTGPWEKARSRPNRSRPAARDPGSTATRTRGTGGRVPRPACSITSRLWQAVTPEPQ